MNALDLIRRLHEHRAWVNARLFTAAGGLTDEQLRRTLEIGQGSIWRSLCHLYAAEYVWLAALEGTEASVAPGDIPTALPGNQEAPDGAKSLAKLGERWSELDGRWRHYLATLTPEALDEIVYRKRLSVQPPERFGTRRSDVLLHVCTHAAYTSAQVNNMLRQVGAKPADVMLIALARSQTPSSV